MTAKAKISRVAKTSKADTKAKNYNANAKIS